jgi:DNA-binding transcriptional LysR family regulator
MDFRIRQLQCFLVLAEKLNYGQAARAQFMTQPTLSFQIKSLEEDFGARLFDRNHKGVNLTAAGHHLVLSARRILSEIDSVYKQIANTTAQIPLRVCCSQAGQLDVFPKLIRALSESNPELQMDINYTIPEERVMALANGKLDVLMMVAPVQAPGVTFQLLRRETLVAMVPDSPQFRERKSISIHELAKSPLLVASERECKHCKQFTLSVMQQFKLTPAIVETSVNLNFMMSMIAAGKGVGIVSESLLNLRFPGVLFLPFEEKMPRTKLGVAWRTNDTSPSLAVFHEALVRIAYRRSADMKENAVPVFAGMAELAERSAAAQVSQVAF